jgi:hypothetical protein
MNKLNILFLLLVFSCYSFAKEDSSSLLLKNINFKEGLLHWQSSNAIKDTAFSVIKENDTNILKISGGKKEVSQLVQSVNILPEKLFNKRVNFFATVKVENLSSGAMHLMIREVNAKGKTVRYRLVKITKWTSCNWQKHNISFVVKNPTKYLQVYLRSNYLTSSDSIYVKDLQLKISNK